MPPSQPTPTGGTQGANAPHTGSLSSPVIRSMAEDLRRLSPASAQSVSGSGKVMWPSDAPGAPTPNTPQNSPQAKGGFFASLLQPKHHDEVAPSSLPPSSAQKIPVHGEGNGKTSVWDARVPMAHSVEQFPGSAPVSKLPLSALPIPQKPIVAPTPKPAIAASPIPSPAPIISPQPPKLVLPPTPTIISKPAVPSPAPFVAATIAPSTAPTPSPVPSVSSSIFAPSPRPPAPPISRPSSPLAPLSSPAPATPPKEKVIMPSAPSVGQVMQAPPKPVVPPQPKPTLVPVPRPTTATRPLERKESPRIITPVSTARTTIEHGDDDIGIDLGISDYLKGGPTFQINNGGAPIAKQAPIRTPVPESVARPLSASVLVPVSTPSASIFAPTSTPTPPSTPTPVQPQAQVAQPPQHAVPKPAQANTDLDTEKQRLINERAQIVGTQSAIDENLRVLSLDKQQEDNRIKPIVLRETQLANEIDELERKEQGLTGELRRTIERDRWVKVEERRKVEQERILVKRGLIAKEGDIHAKEEEKVSLVKRGKDVAARIVWIDAEYKRRDVRLKLAGVNQEKTNIEQHRMILDNGLKRLKASLEETERSERRLVELKRSLAIKMPQNIAEEERFAQERFDIEKQMHDMELRRWSLEDELRNATDLFAKEDMAYLDVMHRSEALESELKALG